MVDNEISTAYRLEIKKTSMNYQLVPPDDRSRKDHFIRVMSGTAESFPAQIRCQAIPQAERQLLILRQSNVNPRISVYDHVYGLHN